MVGRRRQWTYICTIMGQEGGRRAQTSGTGVTPVMAAPVSLTAGASVAVWSTFANGAWTLLAAVVTSIVGYYVSEKIKGRYRIVRLTRRGRRRYYAQFAELYCDRIEPDQQISTSVIADHAIDRRSALPSRRRLRQMLRRGEQPPIARQLYMAVRRGQVLGFLFISVHLSQKYIFIAYLGTKKPPDIPTDVARRLLTTARDSAARFLEQPVFLFEVSPPASQSLESRAKCRHFSNYAKDLGLATRRILVPYVQPEMNPESLDHPTELLADLYISAEKPFLDSLDRSAYLAMIRSIYLDIYPNSFSDTTLQPSYLDYISSLYSRMEATLTDPLTTTAGPA
jgi:hypothetical protein